MELSWKQLPDVPAAADGSAYAEFWLYSPGSARRHLALSGVVTHIAPVLEELLRSADAPQATKHDRPSTAK